MQESQIFSGNFTTIIYCTRSMCMYCNWLNIRRWRDNNGMWLYLRYCSATNQVVSFQKSTILDYSNHPYPLCLASIVNFVYFISYSLIMFIYGINKSYLLLFINSQRYRLNLANCLTSTYLNHSLLFCSTFIIENSTSLKKSFPV